jgi:chitodextrinase
MIRFTPSIKSVLLTTFILSGLSACGGGGGGDSGGNTDNGGGGFNSGNPNTKPQTSSSAMTSSSVAMSSVASLSSSKSSRSVTGADLSAPTAPDNFEVGLKVYDAIGLSWTLSTDNVAVVSYKIYRDNVQIGDAGEVDSVFLDFDVAPDKSYNYSIAAVDAVGNASTLKSVAVRTPPAPFYPDSSSSSSNSSSISSASTSSSSIQSSTTSSLASSKSSSSSSTIPDATPPTAPNNLVTTAVYSTQIDLQWTAGTDNQAVASYRIYRDGLLQTTVKAGALSFTDKTVTQNKTYTYAIESVDLTGNTSLTRKILSVTTPAAATNGDVTLYWAVPTQREDESSLPNTEIGGYLIRYKSTISTEFLTIYIPSSVATSYIIPNLVGDYEFQIAAYDKNNLYSKFVSLSPH